MKLANKLTIEEIQNLSDEEIIALSMPRPGYPEMKGFMFPMRAFSSTEEMAEIMCALLERLEKQGSRAKISYANY